MTSDELVEENVRLTVELEHSHAEIERLQRFVHHQTWCASEKIIFGPKGMEKPKPCTCGLVSF